MVHSSEKDVFTPELLDLLEKIGSSRAENSAGIEFSTACTHATNPSLPHLSQGDSRFAGSVNLNYVDFSERQCFFESMLKASVSPCGVSVDSGGENSCSTAHGLSPLEARGSENRPIMLKVDGVSVSAAYMDLPTTLMIKNIPNRLTREQLVDEVLSRLPVGSFDFLYLPNDFKTRAGFGYAFINLTSSEAVNLFLTEFNKKRLNCAGGVYSKPIEVSAARVQGFTANVNRLISSPVLFSADEGSLPLIFKGGQVPIPFKTLMQLNRASVLFQTRPSIEELMTMVEAELLQLHD